MGENLGVKTDSECQMQVWVRISGEELTMSAVGVGVMSYLSLPASLYIGDKTEKLGVIL